MPDDRPSLTPGSLPQESAPAEKAPGLIARWRQRLTFKSGERLRANLEEVLEEDDARSAPFSEEERTMLRSILELRERRAVDLALPRTDIVSVQKETELGDLIATFEDCGHTRLIVHDDSLDDPVGMVHIKDVLGYLTAQARIKGGRRRKGVDLRKMDLGLVDLTVRLSAIKLIRPVLFVPPSMPALDLLQRMQASRIQLALVIDEYGGTDGLVAIKDIVETIVGDIEDEHDEDQGSPIVAQADGRFIADARASVEDLQAALGERFKLAEETASDIDTLGGYLTMLAGHVPVRGEVILGADGFEYEVLDADPRRVKKLRITWRNGDALAVARDNGRSEEPKKPSAGSLPAPQEQGGKQDVRQNNPA